METNMIVNAGYPHLYNSVGDPESVYLLLIRPCLVVCVCVSVCGGFKQLH